MISTKISAQQAQDVKKLLNDCRNVAILTHTSPDGDAIGSSLAMYEFLKRKGKNPVVIVPNYIPDFLRWMNNSDKIVQFDRRKALAYNHLNMADLIIGLDFNQLARIDELGDVVRKIRCKKLLIDHHLGPDAFADVTVSFPDCSSTCELLFRVMLAIGESDRLNTHAAEDIYAGMCTDTGGFTYNSKDPDIFNIIAELLKKGIDKDLIYRRIYNNYSVDRYRLMGYVLYKKLIQYPDLHASVFGLTREELSQFNYLKGDMEGVVNLPLAIKGQKVSISLREDTEKPVIWVSIRSYDDFPANELAQRFFNGGGHFNAAGGHLDNTSIDEALEIARQAFEAYRDKLAD